MSHLPRELELHFPKGSDRKLSRTKFRHPFLDNDDHEVKSARGKDAATVPPDHGWFQWTKAVQGLVILLLRTAAWGLRARNNGTTDQPTLKGFHNTPASSLNFALSKKTDWICDMFGFDVHGEPFLSQMINRSNPDLKRPNEEVGIAFNVTQLPATQFKIFVGDEPCKDPDELDRMADEIEANWGRTPVSNVAPPSLVPRTPRRPASAVRTIKGVRIKIKLDRDFDTYPLEEQNRLLDLIRIGHGCASAVLISKKRGCVELTLELTPDEADRLYRLAQSGDLDDFGVFFAEKVIKKENVTPLRETMASTLKKYPIPNPLHARWTQLLVEAKEGSLEVLGTLFGEIDSLLRSHLRKLTSSHPRLEIDDIVQDTFLAVASSMSRYDPARASAFGWIWTICRNMAITRLRRPPGKLTQLDTQSDEPDVVIVGKVGPSSVREPIDELMDQEEKVHIREELRRALARLDEVLSTMPSAAKMAFRLRLQGESYQQLAHKIGVPVGTVATWIHRARKKLLEDQRNL